MGFIGGGFTGQGAFNAIGKSLKGIESAAFQIITGTAKSYTLNHAAGRVISTVGTSITVNSAKAIFTNITGSVALNIYTKCSPQKLEVGDTEMEMFMRCHISYKR